jgi:copper chaperone
MARMIAHSEEISCEGCANAIKRALGRMDGVKAVEVSVPDKDIQVVYDDAALTSHQVLERLSRAGYDSSLKS